MLNINAKRELITGPFARVIRERMRCIKFGKLNENDFAEIRRLYSLDVKPQFS